MTTLEKIKRLEQYLATETTSVDPLLDLALDKLMQREANRLAALEARLQNQLVAFEQTYALRSNQFYDRYQRGTMGDEMDFIEWAATIEMVELLNALPQPSVSETYQREQGCFDIGPQS